MGGGYYVYSYNDVCVLVEGGMRDNECGQKLFSVKISHRHSHTKKKTVFHTLTRGPIFFIWRLM